LVRFRVYLRDKYLVDKAYYFLGALQSNGKKLYERIQAAGFILVFREHSQSMIGKNKLAKVLAPNKKSMSSLYKQIDSSYRTFLEEKNIKYAVRH
jgi:hypothetical protein